MANFVRSLGITQSGRWQIRPMIRFLAIALTIPLHLPLALALATVPSQADCGWVNPIAAPTSSIWGPCHRQLWQGLADSAISVYRQGTLSQTPQPSPSPTTETISFETQEQGNYSGFNDSFERLITEESEWQGFWQQLHGTVSPSPDIPEIDFENYSIIAVGLGDRSDGSYGVQVDRVRQEGEELVVHYLETRGCGMATMAITQPYHIVRIERTSRPVSFQHHQAPPDC
ncbi:MAG: protease complex subunit PrcB family protein [Phormidium sp. GEM2.Bin31]|nr:MAG: protease complex subunit PrcB family protein [Phormidium sp. GEM2.Bin31]